MMQNSKGGWEVCIPEDESVLRLTVSGSECMFPFEYQGETATDCVDVNGAENCKVG